MVFGGEDYSSLGRVQRGYTSGYTPKVELPRHIPVKTTVYELGRVEIHCDLERGNSHWYACVPVNIKHKRDGDTVTDNDTVLEIILNGEGKSKARKKITRVLRHEGIDVSAEFDIAETVFIDTK